jgi:hypothetical protein
MINRITMVVYSVLNRKSEMQLVCRNDHGQLGIRFCFKWHLLLKHATVSMVILYKHTKWSRWCITASLNYKNTMINRITMETVACLRNKCHLKQNLIPSWPWSFPAYQLQHQLYQYFRYIMEPNITRIVLRCSFKYSRRVEDNPTFYLGWR